VLSSADCEKIADVQILMYAIIVYRNSDVVTAIWQHIVLNNVCGTIAISSNFAML